MAQAADGFARRVVKAVERPDEPGVVEDDDPRFLRRALAGRVRNVVTAPVLADRVDGVLSDRMSPPSLAASIAAGARL